ncbi:hypothetical protein V8F33_003959 [Rhypophila sp. PSN 637]
MKPSLGWDDMGITFNVCDKRGSNANAHFVLLKDGWTFQQARAEAVFAWDENESRRVREYNIKLGVCWAPSRLLTFLRHHNSPAGQQIPPPSRNEHTIDLDQLVTLITCQSRLEEIVSLNSECKTISGSRPPSGAFTFYEHWDEEESETEN